MPGTFKRSLQRPAAFCLVLIACLAARPARAAPDGPQPPPATAPAVARGDDTIAALASQLDKAPTTVVATVNGTPISLGALADRLRELPPNMKTLSAKELFNLALNDLVQQRAAVLKAKELHLDSDPRVQRRMTEASDHELISALLAREAPADITDQAVQDLYKKDIADKPGPDEVQLRVIVTPTKAEADEALRRIGDGMDFAEAARTYSHDSSKATGGEIGYVQKNQLSAETGAVAFALAPGQMTAFPVFSNGLWFILRCEGRRQRAAPTLADAAPQLRRQLLQQAAVAVLKTALEAAKVQVFGAVGDTTPPEKK